jgi:hypothetical protein
MILMRRSQRVANLDTNPQNLLNRKNTASQPLRQCLTGDKLHYQKIRSAGLLQPVDCRDVGMVERGEYSYFAPESRQPVRIAGKLVRQSLNGDIAAELGIVCLINLAHAAFA